WQREEGHQGAPQAAPRDLSPPPEGRIVCQPLLHGFVYCVLYVGLWIADIAASEMQAGHQHRLGDHINAVATIEGHLACNHAVEMPWLSVGERLLEFVCQRTVFLDRIEVNHRPPRRMGRYLDEAACLGCRITHH